MNCEHKHVDIFTNEYNIFIQHHCQDCGVWWKTKDEKQAISDHGYIRVACTCDIDKDHCFNHSDKSICGLCDKACPSTEKGASIGAISWMCDECASKKENKF